MSLSSPTMPSTTTTTTHCFDRHEETTPHLPTSSTDSATWTQNNNVNHVNNVNSNTNTNNNSNNNDNNNPSNPFNALDLWFEQATACNSAPSPVTHVDETPAAPLHSNTLPDMSFNDDPNLSLDFNRQDLEQHVSNPFASNAVQCTAATTPVTPSSPPQTQKKQRMRHQQYHSRRNQGATVSNMNNGMNTKQHQPHQMKARRISNVPTSNSPVTSDDIMRPSSSKPVGSNSVTDSPIASHSDSNSNVTPSTKTMAGPSSSLTSTALTTNPEEDPMGAVNALAAHSSSHDGLSAVERAKRSAEEFTMSQLAQRKRKATSPPVNNSLSDEDGEDGSGGAERQSHRKYQKRLQKNRDSAFVSRIRRREYTRILENSLSTVEKEKDSAMAAFREMKRRFDVVSAELAGIKTAAASNFAGIRDAFINRVHVPDVPSGIFVPPPGSSFHPGTRSAPFKYPVCQPQSYPPPPVHSSKAGTTIMYMVALVVGVLIPGLSSSGLSSGQSNSTMRGANLNNSSISSLGSPLNSSANNEKGSTNGKVWRNTGHPTSDEYATQADISLGAAKRLINSVANDAVERLGDENAQKAVDTLQNHLEQLSMQDVEEIERNMEKDGNHSGFEALVRAVLREEGSQVEEDDLDLEQIIMQVGDLNVENRL